MQKYKVWGLPVRLFHWALVILFFLSVYSGFQDKWHYWADVHLYAGVSILVLVLWRIVWGFIGSDTERFASFLKPPAAIWTYMKNWRRAPRGQRGHNPLGGLVVVIMLVMLCAQALMGLFASDAMFFSGPLARLVSESTSGTMTARHALLGYGLMGLVGLHILAILLYRLIKGEDLLTPMITGRKFLDDNTPEPIQGSNIRAMALLIGVAILIYLTLLA